MSSCYCIQQATIPALCYGIGTIPLDYGTPGTMALKIKNYVPAFFCQTCASPTISAYPEFDGTFYQYSGSSNVSSISTGFAMGTSWNGYATIIRARIVQDYYGAGQHLHAIEYLLYGCAMAGWTANDPSTSFCGVLMYSNNVLYPKVCATGPFELEMVLVP